MVKTPSLAEDAEADIRCGDEGSAVDDHLQGIVATPLPSARWAEGREGMVKVGTSPRVVASSGGHPKGEVEQAGRWQGGSLHAG